MKVLITGMNGTVAPALARRLKKEGMEIVAWDRNKVSIDDADLVRTFILAQKPTWLVHCAMGSPVWAATMAGVCKEEGIKFLYTGSVSVFNGAKPGPFAIDKVPDAPDDYGRYKAESERQVFAANPDAIVARLGWQIGDAPGSNNMIDFFFKTVREKGKLEVSSGVIHSNAFLEDTADALYRLLAKHPAGLYQLEGNPGLSLFEIATRLKKLHKFDFPIIEQVEPRRDIRMVNDKIKVGQLTDRLPA
jgi:dTDP-4-dehydrorhamnose reductase